MPNAAGSQGKKLCSMQLVVKREDVPEAGSRGKKAVPDAAGCGKKKDVPDAASSQRKKLCPMQLVVEEKSCAQCSWY